MMKNLFHAFKEKGVAYLLISGQACILYGASQFTEDVDIWVRPDRKNLHAFLRAMAQVDARVYKLTPPITPTYVRKGHGFHFTLKGDFYLDVMGKPPRVGPFAGAHARARTIPTVWGKLLVVAPEDLVLLKRTNRPADYEAISNLVRLRVSEDNSPRTLYWGLNNTFDITDLVDYVAKGVGILKRWPPRSAVQRLLPMSSRRSRLPDAKIHAAARDLAIEMGELQEAGRRYWKPVIAELKQLQRSRRLIPEGTPVTNMV